MFIKGLTETVVKRGHNIYFHSEIRKIIFEWSSIPSLIFTSETFFIWDTIIICISQLSNLPVSSVN